MGEVLAFRTKRLTGFLPDDESKPVEGPTINVAEPIFDHRDTLPSEYVAPKDDQA